MPWTPTPADQIPDPQQILDLLQRSGTDPASGYITPADIAAAFQAFLSHNYWHGDQWLYWNAIGTDTTVPAATRQEIPGLSLYFVLTERRWVTFTSRVTIEQMDAASMLRTRIVNYWSDQSLMVGPEPLQNVEPGIHTIVHTVSSILEPGAHTITVQMTTDAGSMLIRGVWVPAQLTATVHQIP
jgi:hypothetical protein